MAAKRCTHLDQIVEGIEPSTPEGCEECLAINFKDWYSLRMCLTCGHVGCCDDSKYKHATKHFQATDHPIMTGYKTKAQYRWCYIDDMKV